MGSETLPGVRWSRLLGLTPNSPASTVSMLHGIAPCWTALAATWSKGVPEATDAAAVAASLWVEYAAPLKQTVSNSERCLVKYLMRSDSLDPTPATFCWSAVAVATNCTWLSTNDAGSWPNTSSPVNGAGRGPQLNLGSWPCAVWETCCITDEIWLLRAVR